MSQISTSFIADPELFQMLNDRAQSIAAGSNRLLFRQGDPPIGVYLLKSGTARLTSLSESGDEIFTVKVGAGSLLGLPAVIGMKPYSLTAEVLKGAQLSMLTCENFVEVMQQEPSMLFRLLQVLASEVRFARETLAHL